MAARRRKTTSKDDESPQIRFAERLLIESLDDLPGKQALCVLSSEGFVAAALAEMRPRTKICCHFLDAGAAQFASSTRLAEFDTIEVVAQSDLPVRPFDLVLVPFPSWGEVELARELLEQAVDVMAEGGALAAATDPPGDGHLQVEFKKLFAKFQRRPFDDGVVYVAKKAGPLRKRRDFTYEFAFRDRRRLFQAVSRPGLLSHRRLHAGLRPLLDAMEIGAGERVLNPGCDAGVIALAGAARAEGATVFAVDSNCRAVDCTRRGAEANGLTNVTAVLAPGRWAEPRNSFDVVLACPPYIPNERVADIYIDGAVQALKRGGRIILSSKHRVWFRDELARAFDDVSDEEVRDHFITRGVRR